ncbi:hypothetical protein COY91_02440 [Candidatus Shapirobacteria bacterium CG_4_10_14_0_8_um_filter_39_15]|nr:MAG: hypothetical protein COY91_02440 [Candidatus Shapirobacteria bacterium CG_4_10_14_0_8_um_filter_39_15]PJE67978.1 MAG: hypothetical protein COU94_04265 [Candidatus Shapirobacteria bacterium CG10_big_fil_rev_8_21_14_0_10_38_8]
MNTILSNISEQITSKILKVDIKIPRDALSLLIRDREKVSFRNMVNSVTSISDKGVFDILPQHANFISMIKEKIIIRRQGKEDVRIPITIGVLKVQRNQVEIYLDVTNNTV